MGGIGRNGRGIQVAYSDLPLMVYGLLVLAYLVARSASVSFSWDEAYTYLHHVQHGVLWPERFDDMGANLHVLNVWLMWVADRFVGPHEWMLRLPNVLAGALYLGLGFMLVREVRPWPVALALYILLTAHPYMLDMFSLARGYGLGISFMFLSLLSLRKYAIAPNLARGLGAMLGAGFAALSNLIFLNYLFAAVGTMAVLLFVEAGPARVRWTRAMLIFAVAIPFLAATSALAFQLSAGGSLYFGSADLPESIRSVAIKVFYHLPDYEDPVRLFKWALGVALLVPFALLLAALASRMRGAWYPLLPGLLVLVLWSFGMALEHAMFGTPWPHARTGVAIVPLASFLFVTSWMSPLPGARVWRWAACILAVPVLQLQARALNLTYCIEWKASGEVRSMFERVQLAAASARPGGGAITVCSGFESQMPLFYYRALFRMHNLSVSLMQPDQNIPRSDLYLVEYNAMDRIDTVNWELDYWSSLTNAKLFRDRRNYSGNQALQERSWATLDDGSWPGDVRLFGDQLFGGAIKYVFDERTAGRPWLVVKVPVKSGYPDDWVSMDVLLRRDGRVLENRSVRTSGDVRLVAQDTMMVAFGPEMAVMPGDSLHVALWAATGQREQMVGRAQLSIHQGEP